MIKVVSVKPLEGYKLELEFTSGERRVFRAESYLDKGIFTELKDPAYFRAARVAGGTVTWPLPRHYIWNPSRSLTNCAG